MNKKSALLLNFIVIIGLLLTSCGILPTSDQSAEISNNEQSLKQAEVVFKAWIPENTPDGSTINIDILDEVTGLAIYPTRYTLTQSSGYLYEVHVPVNIGSVVKYRYSKINGSAVSENNSSGDPIRYRMAQITGPAIVEDVIYAWGDLPIDKPTGKVQGRVLDETSNTPVANMLITAGGISTFTSAEGDYILEGLPIGTHNLVAYSIDGKYTIYQQGAMVAENATTPANIKVRPTQMVNVTFVTNTPVDASGGLPIRIIGNLYQLGNTYADLSAGFSSLENRAPMMTIRDDGSYAYTIQLPVGFDLRYKYTLGDGFWNAEHYSNGGFRVRQIIVPSNDVVINDLIDTWSINKTPPFVFRLTVPDGMPVTDTVSLQLNPFDWTPPLEMWPLGDNQFIYVLYGPYQLMGNISYRYCRNDQCDKSSGVVTGKTQETMVLASSTDNKDISDVISNWTNFGQLENEAIVAVDIKNKVAGFVTGFQLTNDYSPVYQSHYIDAINSIYQSKGNMIILSPTWSITNCTPPIFEPIPGKDMMKGDFEQITNWINQTQISLAVFPQVNVSEMDQSMNLWWLEAERSDGWWQSWFDRYRSFLINYAIYANQVQADAIILNDGNINPALPSGHLSDGTPSGVPGDAYSRWKRIFEDIRAVYGGEIYWAVYEDSEMENLSDVISLADKVYYPELSPALLESESYATDVHSYFRENIYPIYEKNSKPVIVGITFGESLTPKLQAKLYQTVLEEINSESWVAGVVSNDFNPTIRVQDNSNSVFGKHAMEILKYWYPKFND